MKIAKRILCMMLVLCVMSAVPVNAASVDADAGGAVGTRDVRLYLRYAVGLESDGNVVDVNGDGVVNTLDAKQLLTALTGMSEAPMRLNAFRTPCNSSLTSEEIEQARVARLVNTYDEFEAVCGQLRPYFYTPYDAGTGSFDAWSQTVTPAFFETKSLFVVSHCTAFSDFALEYAVKEESVDLTIVQSKLNSFCAFECWQLAIEMDKTEAAGRELKLAFAKAAW